jgi:2-dehydro-3-deoxy-D-gluconate 5-dehydrogenase
VSWGPFSLEGKHAVVTGGAMGIGFGIVSRLVEAGADVLIADLDGDLAAEKAATLDGPTKVVGIRADVSDVGSGDAIVAAAVEAFGPIDVLVNNAGIYPQVPMLQTTPELWDRVQGINLRGLAFVSKAVGAHMVERKTGTIVNIASIDGLHPSMVGLAAYDASKGGVVMFTRNFALEMAAHGVRVNAIAPGGIATEGTSAPLEGSGMTEEELKAMMEGFIANKIPLGRMGEPDDIATVTVFLASPASGYMTGEIVVVDGGTLLT